MGIKRVVDVDFWKDDVVAERFSAEDRYFFLYLLTNPSSKQCGIFHLPLRLMAFEMGHSKDSVESIVDRFETRFGNIIYNKETQEIAILNFLKHSIIKGGKPVEDCIRKELEKVKDKSLIVAVYKHMLPHMDAHIEKNEKSMYKGIKEILLSFINEDEIKNEVDNDNDNDNERIVPRIVERIENDTSTSDIYKEIISYLNLKTSKSFRSNNKETIKHINARLKEGFTIDDFKKVIDIKTTEWLNTNMDQYLRPQTLFNNKFESYLNTKVNTFNKSTYNNNQPSGDFDFVTEGLAKMQNENRVEYTQEEMDNLGF